MVPRRGRLFHNHFQIAERIANQPTMQVAPVCVEAHSLSAHQVKKDGMIPLFLKVYLSRDQSCIAPTGGNSPRAGPGMAGGLPVSGGLHFDQGRSLAGQGLRGSDSEAMA